MITRHHPRHVWPVRKVLRRSGLTAELGEDHLWHSISQGVREVRRAHGVKHIPATGGIAGAEDGPGEDFVGEDGRGIPRRRRRDARLAGRTHAGIPGAVGWTMALDKLNALVKAQHPQRRPSLRLRSG
jgi:hypothetical protein